MIRPLLLSSVNVQSSPCSIGSCTFQGFQAFAYLVFLSEIPFLFLPCRVLLILRAVPPLLRVSNSQTFLRGVLEILHNSSHLSVFLSLPPEIEARESSLELYLRAKYNFY